ncbi:hypothetical protein AB3N59_16040 [Leptospira sp. WS92.C1]
MKRILFLFLILLFHSAVFSQNNPLWQTIFGGEQYNGLKPNECPEELPSGLTVLKDGSYIVAGSANNCSNQDTNALIEQKRYSSAWAAKIDSSGNPVWWKYLFTSKPVDMDGYTINVHNFDSYRGKFLTATQDGGFVGAGTIGSSTFNRKLSFAKHDTKGELVTDRFMEAKEFCDEGFCGLEDPQIFHLQELSNEKFRGLVSVSHKVEKTIKEGNTTSISSSYKTSFLYTLFSKDGSVKNSKYIPDLEFAPNTTAAFPDGGFVLAVTTNNVSGKESQRDVIVQRYDEDGKQLWKKKFGNPGVEELPIGILNLSDGNILLSGGIMGGKEAVWLLKLSPQGETIWETKQKIGGFNFIDPIIESPDQGFFGVLGNGEGPMVFVKFDSSGKKVWEKKQSQRLYMPNEILKNEKGYVILAYTKKKPAQYIDAILIQTDWDGNISKEAFRKNFP